jgi:hypothetical protein
MIAAILRLAVHMAAMARLAQQFRNARGKRGTTPGAGAFFVCLGSEQSDSSYV